MLSSHRLYCKCATPFKAYGLCLSVCIPYPVICSDETVSARGLLFLCLQVGLGVAVRYLLDLGPQWAFQRISTLAQTLRNMLGTVSGVAVHDKGPRLVGIVTFSVVGRLHNCS